MRRTRIRSLAVVVVAVLGATACSASTTSSAPTTSTGVNASPATTTPPTITVPSVVPTTIVPPARVGSGVSLPALDQNPPVQVTLVNLVDPAQGADQFSLPVAGSRFVGVQIRVVFGGSGVVGEDLNADTAIYDTRGNAYSASTASLLNCPPFGSNATVGAGKAAQGCVAFEVGANARINSVTFTPGGQFGSLSAQWRVP